ncbi:condensation domain-containing protein [Saccharothrix variisporea]|nr:condensation domain-containing protein [Saccharothrix variisporea]
MWLLERLVPGTGVNNVTVAFEVDGRFDRAVLGRALDAVLARHDVLRTVFRADDVALDKEVLASVDVPLLDIAVTDAGLDADLTAFIAAPFALDGSPLVRAGVRSGDTDVCCVVVHHLVFDAMSTTILLRELLTAYEEVAAGHTPATEVVSPPTERTPDERSIAYWQKNLDGLRASESGLWCAKPPGAQSSLRASTVHHKLSAEAREVVRRFQKELRASEAVVLLAAYYVLLTQHGAGSDVVIGTPVNVRDQQSMNAIGYHANLLPLRVQLEADFRAVVKKTRSTFLEAISHADVPLEHVSPAVLGDTPSSWRSSFFRHLFNYVPGTVESAPTLTGMPVRHVLAENGFSRFDLEFFIMPGPAETTIRAAFCVDAFEEADVVRLLERYDALLVELGGAVERPVVELSRLAPSEHVLPPASKPVEHVLDAVHATVAAQPDLVAVEDGPDSVTYGELWSAALDTRDLVHTDTVAVLAPRGADLAAAWLGVWLAGARLVLLDPTQPIPDLAARLADSGAGLVLAAEGVTVPGAVRVPTVGGGTRTEAPTPDLDAPAHLEYALTGEPIAVEFTHQALASAVTSAGQDKALWQNSAATTASLLDVLGALTTGGRVVVADTEHTAPAPTGFIAEPGTAHELGLGVRGELCATGPALPTRYHNRPDLTAERFGEHPVHGRFHRTGDLAVRRATGIDVIGRLDDHVTVAGQRIHLTDIERALSAIAPVAAAEAGGTVFVFTETDATDQLREHAKTTLPFVPEIVTMTKLPRTAASTLDRTALRDLAESSAVAANAEPADETTTALVAIWTELLDRPGLHADSNFFASGGHSLLGAQLVQKVKKELSLPAQLADLFANPTPRQLAEHLDSAFFDDEDD